MPATDRIPPKRPAPSKPNGATRPKPNSKEPANDPAIEEWRPVVGYEGWYDVSSLGRVRRSRIGHHTRIGLIKRFVTSNCGYLRVSLSSGAGTKRMHTVHRLVAAAFVGCLTDGMVVNHKDGCKTNNVVANLEVVTASENTRHAVRTGLMRPNASGLRRPGELNSQAKLTADKVREIRSLASSGVMKAEIASRFGVTRTAVYLIVARKKWVHV